MWAASGQPAPPAVGPSVSADRAARPDRQGWPTITKLLDLKKEYEN